MEYKGFKIVGDNQFGYFNIKQMGSGAVPVALDGNYTTMRFAQIAIDSYQPQRGAKQHAKANSTADV